jgi:beta-phosphoglucomutase
MPSNATRQLRAVIFDLDGVLVSTDRFHYLAWKELADKLGLAFDEQVNHRLRGVSRRHSLEIIYEHNRRPYPPEAELLALCESKNSRYVELVGAMTPTDVLPGSISLLESLRAEGVRLAVASVSKNAPLVLDRTGMQRYFDAVSDGNVARKSKPDPEVFLLAASMLKVGPADCIGVEDAAVGIEAIHNAGMIAVGIGDTAVGADFSVRDVTHLNVATFREIFGFGTHR